MVDRNVSPNGFRADLPEWAAATLGWWYICNSKFSMVLYVMKMVVLASRQTTYKRMECRWWKWWSDDVCSVLCSVLFCICSVLSFSVFYLFLSFYLYAIFLYICNILFIYWRYFHVILPRVHFDGPIDYFTLCIVYCDLVHCCWPRTYVAVLLRYVVMVICCWSLLLSRSVTVRWPTLRTFCIDTLLLRLLMLQLPLLWLLLVRWLLRYCLPAFTHSACIDLPLHIFTFPLLLIGWLRCYCCVHLRWCSTRCWLLIFIPLPVIIYDWPSTMVMEVWRYIHCIIILLLYYYYYYYSIPVYRYLLYTLLPCIGVGMTLHCCCYVTCCYYSILLLYYYSVSIYWHTVLCIVCYYLHHLLFTRTPFLLPRWLPHTATIVGVVFWFAISYCCELLL